MLASGGYVITPAPKQINCLIKAVIAMFIDLKGVVFC